MAVMPAPNISDSVTQSSPDPSSHALNRYDDVSAESEWVDEGDEAYDDMDSGPVFDESQDNDSFDPNEGTRADFHGNLITSHVLSLF